MYYITISYHALQHKLMLCLGFCWSYRYLMFDGVKKQIIELWDCCLLCKKITICSWDYCLLITASVTVSGAKLYDCYMYMYHVLSVIGVNDCF